MKDPANVFLGAAQPPHPCDGELRLPEDWRLVRGTHANLLLIHSHGVIQDVLELLQPDLSQPIATWSPGEPLVLPPSTRPGTVILKDVGALDEPDQRRLLEWLELSRGRARVVSTTRAPLLPSVEAGDFNDTLYYRLNTVCVDVTA